MFLKKIKEDLHKSHFFRQLEHILAENRSNVLLHNMNNSAKALIVAFTFFITEKNVILVSTDDRLAEEFLDDLEILVGRQNTEFLPDFEVLPYEQRSPHYTIRSQRIEALSRAIYGKPAIYSIPLRSYIRELVPKEIFSKNIINIKNGEEHNLDNLLSKLVGMGYEMTYQVSKVGDVAKRGGIIDVFSPNRKNPVRIDFFGDEVDTIREFKMISQRSTGKKLKEVNIIPSREFSIHDIEADNKLWQRINNEGFYDGIELDIPLLFPETDGFIDYVDNENTLIFWDEFQNLNNDLEDIYEETKDLWIKARKDNPKKLVPEPGMIFQDTYKFKKKNNDVNRFFLSSVINHLKAPDLTLEAPFSSQTVMHSDLNLLENELKQKLNKGYKIFIQSDNKSQSKRMKDLLPDFLEDVGFTIGVLHKGINVSDIPLAVYTDHEIFSRYKKKRRRDKFSRDKALVDYESLNPGDFIVHIDHGVGVFERLVSKKIGGNNIECLSLRYADGDHVYVPTFQLRLVSKYVSEEGFAPTVHKIGGKRWANSKKKAKKQIELIAQDLVDLYAERKLRKGIKFDDDSPWQKELEDSFLYEDTPDQSRATKEIKSDMESETPMERLLCGDVGFGKTEVAIRAAFKTVLSGYQIAVLVPTTLLAEQHFFVFRERMAQYPVRIAMFSRFRSRKNMKNDIKKLALGQIDIAIGTHRLISKDVKFKRLGLLIVDEEHRFGVRHKEKLRKLKSNVDTLYMSATPIPRTLNMAMSKIKELSLIQTSPKERLPVRTVIINYDEDVIKDAINREMDRGGQVFFIHNRVQTIESVASDIRKIVPNAKIRIAHGQLPEKELESIMIDFSHNRFDILVSTTIIESGIDISNVNTMIVNRADNFGLAQLYQLRGRVGRSNRRAYAYLIIPERLSDIARKRLETLTEYNSLGAGYQIAMRDLELRGAGSLLGTKQSGLINSVGFNYYNRLLSSAIDNLEKKNPKGIWDEDKRDRIETVKIKADYYFPDEYISDQKTKLDIYRRLLDLKTAEEFDELIFELEDRFGELPELARKTVAYYKMRFYASKLKLKSFNVKDEKIILEFNTNYLPGRDKIGKLLAEFDYPVNFDSTDGFRIVFDLSRKKFNKIELIGAATKILKFLYEIE